MELVFYNSLWMAINISLACIALVAGWLMLLLQNKLVRISLGVIWILFSPNTIYMVTDVLHLPSHLMRVPLYAQPLIAIQYVSLFVIGIVTFVLTLYPFEHLLRDRKITD